MVTSAPVGDPDGPVRGAIATFDDITMLEDKSRQLEDALAELEKTRDEVQLHNDELRVLAKCDPLTGVSNRRSFMGYAEHQFESASSESSNLAVIIVDIDHFKRVNDEHGHVLGDEGIQRVAQELLAKHSNEVAFAAQVGYLMTIAATVPFVVVGGLLSLKRHVWRCEACSYVADRAE